MNGHFFLIDRVNNFSVIQSVINDLAFNVEYRDLVNLSLACFKQMKNNACRYFLSLEALFLALILFSLCVCRFYVDIFLVACKCNWDLEVKCFSLAVSAGVVVNVQDHNTGRILRCVWTRHVSFAR